MKKYLLASSAFALVLGVSGSAIAAPIDCEGSKYGFSAFGNPAGGAGSTPGSIVSALAQTDPSLTAGGSIEGALGDTASNVADNNTRKGGTVLRPGQALLLREGANANLNCQTGPD